MRLEKRLLTTARDLARRTKRRPREASMRRAVSTAYYAVFHALARSCADELIGAAKANSAEWSRVYRALDHGTAKAALKGADASSIDKEVVVIGAVFAELQERRHQADYDPAPFTYYFEAVTSLIEQAEDAVDRLSALSFDQRRALAVLLLFKRR